MRGRIDAFERFLGILPATQLLKSDHFVLSQQIFGAPITPLPSPAKRIRMKLEALFQHFNQLGENHLDDIICLPISF